MLEALHNFVHIKQRPFLGICIGMQLMAKKSFERIESLGLGFFDSEVKKKFLLAKLKLKFHTWDGTILD